MSPKYSDVLSRGGEARAAGPAGAATGGRKRLCFAVALRLLPVVLGLGVFGCVSSASAHILVRPDATQAFHAALQSHGVPHPGYLGVSLRDLDASEVTHLHLRAAPANAPNVGAMIVTVDRDAPAWTAGLRPRDIVLELNGQPVDDVEVLRRRLREFSTGDTITIRVWRGGSQMSFAVRLGDQDTIAQDAFTRHLRAPAGSGSSLAASPLNGFSTNGSALDGSTFRGAGSAFLDEPPSPGAPSDASPVPNASRSFTSSLLDALIPSTLYTGLSVAPLTPQLGVYFGTHAPGGLLVTAVAHRSPAEVAGLAAGDVILGVEMRGDGRTETRSITTRSGLASAVRGAHGGPVSLRVMRARAAMTLSLQPSRRRKL